MIIYFPWLPGWPLHHWLPEVPFAFVVDANLAGEYALIALSLVILTGWVGQISLGQGAFVGIGAFTTGLVSRSWGIPFPVSLPIAALVTAGVATILALVALRVRGLYLAVATLIFAWMADAWLFSASWFVGTGGSSSVENRVIGDPASLTMFDLSNPRTMYLVILATVAGAWYLGKNLRDTKTGRAFFAVRGSEMAAVSLGIDVMRYKLLAFALSGGLAGIAGNLMIVDLRSATADTFQFTVSLFYLGMAVVGGITSLGGAVAAGIMFAALTEVFFRVDFLDGWLDVVTIGLLLGVLLGYPGGLGALGPALRERVSATTGPWRTRFAEARSELLGRRRPLVTDEHDDQPAASTPDEEPVDAALAPSNGRGGAAGNGQGGLTLARLVQRLGRGRFGRSVERRSIDLAQTAPRPTLPPVDELAALFARQAGNSDWRNMDVKEFPLPAKRSDRTPILEATGVTVRFGGLTAASNVSLSVREHEIVGLIGPNGAGKTTTFNAIAGLNRPAEGTVHLFGQDVTPLPVHVRAQMGMGRTFQLIQLFPQLSVLDNLLVATHVQNHTGVFAHLTLTPRAIEAELEARERVNLVIELLGLEEIADRQVAGLPFGILRQVEIARALVTEAPLLMLDEPASGLDNSETNELSQLLYYLRSELGVSILLIEHDVRMVTSVCDYIYVLNQGALLTEGTAAKIQRDPAVIAAYLGQSASHDEDRVSTATGS